MEELERQRAETRTHEVRNPQEVQAMESLRLARVELQRQLDTKSAEADEARKQIEKERNYLAVQTKDERLRLAEAEARELRAEVDRLKQRTAPAQLPAEPMPAGYAPQLTIPPPAG